MATTLSSSQAAASLRLAQEFKAEQNREAARIAALVALYYSQRVKVDDPSTLEDWLATVIPYLIRASDDGARRAASFFDAVRRLEVPGAEPFRAEAVIGAVDPGVRKSLLTVGPYAYTNKARKIDELDVGPQQKKALLADAKKEATRALAAATVRHAQAGGRDTVIRAADRDPVALGWVRVTRPEPCFFCAMLASRSLNYRAYKDGSFEMSDARFSGPGDAKVHDECGCSMKAVYSNNDSAVKRLEPFVDMWARWGAGGGDAALRFRRGYEHWAETGEFLTWDEVDAA